MSGPVGTKGARVREVLRTRAVAIPGAFNALTAMQIERAGYEAVYLSGAGLSACRGMPDTGLLSPAEVVAEASLLARAVSIPLIVDADTGYGPPEAVGEAVRAFERAGAAAMQIEDQETAKKCGHLPGKRVIPVSGMVAKIETAVRARSDRDFLIIARTDVRGVEGLDAAIERAVAYAGAGADALFPEALETAEEFRIFAEAMKRRGVMIPLIANMTEFGRTPYLSVRDFESLGYRGVLFPVTALRAAAKAVEQLLVELKLFGTQRDWLDHMMTRRQLYDLLGYEDQAEPRLEQP